MVRQIGEHDRGWAARRGGRIGARRAGLGAALLVAVALAAAAEERALDAAAPGVITKGSDNTTVGGLPAARGGDATSDSGAAVEGGSPNVFINGRPAATAGDRTGCGGAVVGGAPNVFINGKPVARAGDLTTGCPDK
jgi:uncharacterized Zn-binding protein involved in type VI secretion